MLFRKIKRFGQRLLNVQRIDPAHDGISKLRICRFEEVEPRALMTAVPSIHVGATYLDPASGTDGQPNIITVTFQGGADGTELTHLDINGKKDPSATGPNASGLNFNDIIFDTAPGGLGAYLSHPIQIISHDGFDVINANAVDGSTLLTMDFSGFKAGMTLVFSVDVDQVIYVDPTTVEVDAVAEGAEFQRAHLDTTFTAPHFEDASASAQFWDFFDKNFSDANAASGTTLTLPNDHYSPTEDLTVLSDGAVAITPQVPKPITLAGDVYEDHNLNNVQNAEDQGVGSVTVGLLQWDGSKYVNTGKTTVTDSQGNYKFTGLLPGKYEVIKVNPTGYYSVGATAGNVGGTPDGSVVSPDVIGQIDLLGGDDSVHNDFAIARPAALSGFVYHDRNNDGMREPGEEGIGGTTVTLVPVNVIGTPPAPITVVTNPDGSYSATGLNPGVWKILETQPAGYLDGLDKAGSAGGTAQNPGDEIDGISLTSGQSGVEYDFGELLPNSIAGRVVVTTYQDCMDDPNPTPLSGVTIELLSAAGTVIATTKTDQDGKYRFTDLAAGAYSVREQQPDGYIEGDADVGTIAGAMVGTAIGSDLIQSITTISDQHGINYDFCEHPYSTLSGKVQIDADGNCDTNPNEPPLAGVTVQLLDAGGVVIQTAVTNAAGMYTFTHLTPGQYSVRELPTPGYYFEEAHPGSVGGVASDLNFITQVNLPLATDAVQYNFCVLPPGSLGGYVQIDVDGNCDTNPNEPKLAGVTIQLLDTAGHVIGTQITDSSGHYQFDNLAPGTYSVHELPPVGYFEEDSHPGSIGGVSVDVGTIGTIVLNAGVNATDYNFCVIVPAGISGYVYYDQNNDGVYDAGDTPKAGVTVQLDDANCNPTGQTAVTDANGYYHFGNLYPGAYGVTEVLPSGYLAGASNVGSAGGTVDGQMICNAVLGRGQEAVNYNFGLLLPANISGRVQIPPDGDCEGQTDLPGAPNVMLQLLDASGHVLATTRTDANGNYSFTGLPPGTYAVHEVPPANYFLGDSDVGSVGGQSLDANDIIDIDLGSGVSGINYDFCLIAPVSISGTVFQDGPPISLLPGQVLDVPAVRDGKLTPDDIRLPGVTLELRDGVTGAPILGSQAIAGTYAANLPIHVVTDAQGNYTFGGLAHGNYAVFEVRPDGYIDGLATIGTLGGVVVNPYVEISPLFLEALEVAPPQDAILRISVPVGQASTGNNFSVVVTETPFFFIIPPAPPAQLPPALPYYAPPVNGQLNNPQPLTLAVPRPYSGSSQVLNYTWHLSVIDAGQPRGPGASESLVRLTAAQADELAWQAGMEESEWMLARKDERGQATIQRRLLFGMKGAIPVTGDFNGDGITDLGVFRNGHWFIDINANGVWDEGDLWAKLGYEGDKPVTGDWDGDGKDDIGIFGRAWSNDPRAILHEPGLPDSHNRHAGVQKNIPRPPAKTSHGVRSLRLTAQGTTRADLIDHVFHYGTPRDIPLVGDWNGDGTDTIAVFRDGVWNLDLDGDGKYTDADKTVQFGEAGDVPVVGDFDGDGIDELAVFRNGVWLVDMNHNGKLDSSDLVIELGQEGDLPVVGDWDGDGRDDPGIYRDGEIAKNTARRP